MQREFVVIVIVEKKTYLPFQMYFCLVKFISMLGLTLSQLIPVDGVPGKTENELVLHFMRDHEQ